MQGDFEKEVAKRREQAIRKATSMFFLCAGPALLLLFGTSVGMGPWAQLVGDIFSIPVLAVVPYIIYRKAIQGEYVIFWLRNFNQADFRAQNFGRILTGAAKGVGVPVTIQDKRYRYSDAEPSKYILTADLLMKGSLILAVIALTLSTVFVGHLLGTSDKVVTIALMIIFVVCLIGGVWISFRYKRAVGCIRLTESDWNASLEYTLETILMRKQTRTGVVVLETGNSFWRDAVQKAIDYSHVAILDVSEISENLAWEISTVLKSLPPRSVIIAFPIEGDSGRRTVPDDLRQRIDKLTWSGFARRCQFFGYERARIPILEEFSYINAKRYELNRCLVDAIRSSLSSRSRRDASEI